MSFRTIKDGPLEVKEMKNIPQLINTRMTLLEEPKI